MNLYHRTTLAGRSGIEKEGFRHRDPENGGPAWGSEYRDVFWFARSKEIARERTGWSGAWVIVTVPDDTPADPDNADLFGLSKELVNSLEHRFEDGD
ncbi:hypothetical protein [Kineosporia babensis]|uniref:Uncharacterized protein n=1 Tax=Kineosporia babensis TaxID=499548 RepID=A0A9X1SS92_9ACTN|nr:hypothetical protein [Kineosporia babensis]MCD5309355.1 hypothetical protein [Kineosporia babensis]